MFGSVSSLFDLHDQLFDAVGSDDAALVREILKSKYSAFFKLNNFNTRNSKGETLLTLAVRRNNHEIASLLISAKMNIDKTDKSGFTPLHIAIKNNNIELVELLVSNGANVNLPSRDEKSPLWMAATARQSQIVKLLRAKGAM